MSTEEPLLRRDGLLLRLPDRRRLPIAEDMKGITVLNDGVSVFARVKTKAKNPDGTSKDRVQKKTFRGGSLEKNLERAKSWRARMRGLDDEDRLPEGIRRVKRANGFALIATLPTWADERRPARSFPPDALEAACAWLDRATQARAAGLPLPEPIPNAPSHIATDTSAPLFGVAARTWLDSFYAEKAAAGKVNRQRVKDVTGFLETHIIPTLGAYRLEELETDLHLKPAIENLASRGYSITVQKIYLWVLKSTFDYAIARGWSSQNPATLLQPRPPAAKPAAGKRAGRGAENRSRPPAHPRKMAVLLGRLKARYGEEFALAVALERYMGLRISESLAPTIGDVDSLRHQIKVTKQRGRRHLVVKADGEEVVVGQNPRTKTAAGTRVLPVPDFLWPLVEGHVQARLAEGASADDPLMRFDGLVETNIAGNIRKAVRLCSTGILKKKSGEDGHYLPHDFRHQYETDLFNAGVSDLIQSYLLGHSLTNKSNAAAVTLKTYLHDYQESEWERPDAITDFDRTLHAAAEKVDGFIVQALDGRPLLAEDGAKDWLTFAEAAEVLGVTKSYIYHLVKQGDIQSHKTNPETGLSYRLGKNGHPVAVLAADEVAGLSYSGLPVAEAIRVFATVNNSLTTELLLAICRENDINLLKTSRFGWVVPEEDVERLQSVLTLRSDFLKDHWSANAAARTLGVSLTSVQRAVSLGLLSAVEPPVAMVVSGGQVSTWYAKKETLDALVKTLPPAKQKRVQERWASAA